MSISYRHGVRVGILTIDPSRRVDAAFWTHRPARRASARKSLASLVLAASWPGVLGLPFSCGALAMGHRVELLPTGYGLGGAALLLTRAGERTLVVGPTTEALVPRRAHRLVLAAPSTPTPPSGWLEQVIAEPGRVVVPDAGAAVRVVDELAAAGSPPARPAWLGGGPRGAKIRVATSGSGVFVDARPQADEAWQVAFALQCTPELVYVHGPRAQALAVQLADVGLATRLLHGPDQLSFTGLPRPG